MRIAMVSEHADPAAVLGGTDAGGQNVHVGSLAVALAERGHSVTVYTRLTDPGARRRAEFSPGVTVRRLPAGPIAPLLKDELPPHMAEFGGRLARLWQQDPPDIAHAHFWMSGLPTADGWRAPSLYPPAARLCRADQGAVRPGPHAGCRAADPGAGR